MRTVGSGLVTEVDDEKWKKSRALFNHGFHRNVLINSMADFNDKTNILMEKLRSKANGKTIVSMNTEINKFALDIISSVRPCLLIVKYN